ncbi:hypothetical protein [Shumkonia mesophila]|uniref:hypothetical protein n=1 Tax=Shumkonia mesophila TaxID=2838854 RepID=UPI0029343A97|nr:hypothetical protein [Shumkonia mesophila]
MANVDEIRAAIKAKLESVPGIGLVHSYERYAHDQKAFRTLFETSGKVLGWLIRRVATRETSRTIGRHDVTHRWQIRGYMSLDDAAASEIAFDDLVEAGRDAFRADETLGGVVDDTVGDGDSIGLQVEDSGPVMFAGVLCHSVRLGLTTRHTQ